MTNQRPSKDEYYFNIAKEVASRGTCRRRRFGAVIVKNDQIIATGYVGAPRGARNCIDMKACMRDTLKIPPGERYELCRSVHAELNAIINAARAGVSVLGGKMYLHGENIDASPIENLKPCQMCRRAIINAGIEKFLVKNKDGIQEQLPKEWSISDDISLEGY